MTAESATPTKMVTSGVTSTSMGVSLLTALPISAATMATTSTARGPPAPPSAFEAQPTAVSENSTSGGHLSAQPMAIAIAGPLIALAYPPTVENISTPVCEPSVLSMVPISSEQKRPCAIAPSASMP